MVRCPQDDFSTDHGTHQLPRKEQLPTKPLPTFSLQSSITRISKISSSEANTDGKERRCWPWSWVRAVSSRLGGCRAGCIDAESMGQGLGVWRTKPNLSVYQDGKVGRVVFTVTKAPAECKGNLKQKYP